MAANATPNPSQLLPLGTRCRREASALSRWFLEEKDLKYKLIQLSSMKTCSRSRALSLSFLGYGCGWFLVWVGLFCLHTLAVDI
ncbi:uncharacterized protein WM294_000017 isoform 2-T2 [Sarcoramphus papa]